MPLTVAEAVQLIADELGLPPPHRPKQVAAEALAQLALPEPAGGLKAQLGAICSHLDIATGWGDAAGGGGGGGGAAGVGARRFLLAVGGWDSQFRRLQKSAVAYDVLGLF